MFATWKIIYRMSENIMQVGYYAVFNYDEYDPKEEKYGISILFPDIPECNSCARSETEGLVMAKEVSELVTAFYKVHELPKVRSLEEITLGENEKAFLITYNTEDLDVSKFTVFENPPDATKPYTFNNLAADLRTGREIEFAYNSVPCAITNSQGMWWFTQGEQSIAVCEFEDKELLVRKVETLVVFDTTVKEIFDGSLYEKDSLYIL